MWELRPGARDGVNQEKEKEEGSHEKEELMQSP